MWVRFDVISKGQCSVVNDSSRDLAQPDVSSLKWKGIASSWKAPRAGNRICIWRIQQPCLPSVPSVHCRRCICPSGSTNPFSSPFFISDQNQTRSQWSAHVTSNIEVLSKGQWRDVDGSSGEPASPDVNVAFISSMENQLGWHEKGWWPPPRQERFCELEVVSRWDWNFINKCVGFHRSKSTLLIKGVKEFSTFKSSWVNG